MKKILIVAGIATALGGFSMSSQAATSANLIVNAESVAQIEVVAGTALSFPKVVAAVGTVAVNCSTGVAAATLTGVTRATAASNHGTCGDAAVTAATGTTYGVSAVVGHPGVTDLTFSSPTCTDDNGASTSIPNTETTVYCGGTITATATPASDATARLTVTVVYD